MYRRDTGEGATEHLGALYHLTVVIEMWMAIKQGSLRRVAIASVRVAHEAGATRNWTSLEWQPNIERDYFPMDNNPHGLSPGRSPKPRNNSAQIRGCTTRTGDQGPRSAASKSGAMHTFQTRLPI